jgi:hypothetical protein
VRGKLTVAVWAAESKSTISDVQVPVFPAPLAGSIMSAVGADLAWLSLLQEFFVERVLAAGAASPWAVGQSQSYCLLNPALMASLALLATVRLAAAVHGSAEAELAASFSSHGFQALKDGLLETGRSFKDLVKVGSWGSRTSSLVRVSCLLHHQWKQLGRRGFQHRECMCAHRFSMST